MPGAVPGADETVRYRVELVVLYHIDSTAEPRSEAVFRDFSDALDFLAPPPPGEVDPSLAAPDTTDGASQPEPAADCLALPEAPDAVPPADGLTESDETAPVEDAPAMIDPTMLDSAMIDSNGANANGLTEEEAPPAPPAYDGEPGERMQEAWRRLRLSSGFRPELYFSWHQPDLEPFPKVRVHDERLLYIDDPWAAQRQALADAAQEALLLEQELALEAGDGQIDTHAIIEDGIPATDAPPETAPESLPCPPVDGAGLAATDDASEDESPESVLPEPRRFYRIDGTARLRRSRFIHLDLDLEWREPVFAATPAPLEPPPVGPDPAGGETAAPPLPASPPESVAVHRMKQSRQVRTEQVEYFDGPFFAVLAYITEIQEPADDSASVPASP